MAYLKGQGGGVQKLGTSSFGVKPKSSGASSGNLGAWGGYAQAAGAVISGVFESRAESAQAKAQQAASEQDARVAMWNDQYQRKNALQDQRYNEEAASVFRKAYKGDRPVMEPEYTDPNRVTVIDPFAKPTKK